MCLFYLSPDPSKTQWVSLYTFECETVLFQALNFDNACQDNILITILIALICLNCCGKCPVVHSHGGQCFVIQHQSKNVFGFPVRIFEMFRLCDETHKSWDVILNSYDWTRWNVAGNQLGRGNQLGGVLEFPLLN